jgi:hypothetical protein
MFVGKNFEECSITNSEFTLASQEEDQEVHKCRHVKIKTIVIISNKRTVLAPLYYYLKSKINNNKVYCELLSVL